MRKKKPGFLRNPGEKNWDYNVISLCVGGNPGDNQQIRTMN